jgi:hypothetical protein
MKLTVVVELTEFDSQVIAWVEELMDKASEQGEVTLCKLEGLPAVLDFIGSN